MSFADKLYARGPEFDFFQAVRLLELLQHDPAEPGWAAVEDVARFRVHQSLSFPPSAIYAVEPPPKARQVPVVTVNFLGMTGPQGALPTHYTQLLLRIAREGRGTERTALRDWLDLFNHRLIGQFFRAWEKYRFPVPFLRFAVGRRSVGRLERGADLDPDPFTGTLFNLIGLGTPALRHRLHVDAPPV